MQTKLRTYDNPRIPTRDANGVCNGALIPIYNVNDKLFPSNEEPTQVYLTTVAIGMSKGPHLHRVRRGYFTCIRGDVRIVVRLSGKYQEYFSGESHKFRSVEVPRDIPALIVNIGDVEALILNMPFPAWTPSMNDEHTADFSDYHSNV